MKFETQVTFPADHPSLAGHFPGNPVIAGVLILDQVRIALEQWRPGAHIDAVPQVKFAAPLLPQQALNIQLEEHKGKIRFRCQREDELVAQGDFRLVAD